MLSRFTTDDLEDTMADEKSPMYERGAAVLKAIGNPAPGPGRNRFPNLPPEQADDVQRKLTEFCFGDTWGREGSHIDLKTRRLLTIAALVSQARSADCTGTSVADESGHHAGGVDRGRRARVRVNSGNSYAQIVAAPCGSRDTTMDRRGAEACRWHS
jgi:alkylhydroperoxidase/carboxymuconolactone decarboxylase family protein YurZ